MDGQRSSEDLLASGWDALRAGDWHAARGCFEAALAGVETAEAYEGLGWAAYCLDEDPLTIEARERAFGLYRQRGDDQSAARVAAWLAADWAEFRGEGAVCNGWLQRAHRLLDGREPGPGHGWLAVHEASMIVDEDPATARRLAIEAAELGRRFGVAELAMLGLALEGRALVSDGELGEGFRRLDEATVTALDGEAELLSCVAWACCYLISACEQVRDYDRASQWCQQVGAFCERHGISFLLGVCRAKYAGVLTWQGQWDEAERQINRATEGLASRPLLVGEALVRLGELRRVQGRLDEAEEVFARAEGESRALLGRAAVALDRGHPDDAADLAERYLRRYPESHRIERVTGLEVVVRAYSTLNQLARAREALCELQEIASGARTRPLRAAALTADAVVASASGDQDRARRSLEDAVDLLAGTPAAYEIGRTRLELADVLLASGRHREARFQLVAALEGLRALRAEGEVARAEALQRRLDMPDRSSSAGASDGPLSGLTPRELEVLALVAEGVSNHEIAERLVVSEHTVHRHVTSILRKLGLASRAAAAALAVRHGLV
jgi:LuxR family transcriptional regulator, maltose regulon positive regulatory protein